MTRKRLQLMLLLFSLVSCSPRPEGYYELGTGKLQLRLVVPADQEKVISADWQRQADHRGKEFFVSQKAELDENDIEGIGVKSSDNKFDNDLNIVFYFKPTS